MSQQNVEIVRRVFDAVGSGDRATILSLYDPEIEFRAVPGTLAHGIGRRLIYRGYEGLREFDRELHQAFESFQTTCEELIEADERVVSASKYRARGRESGIEVDGPLQFGVWRIRDGKVIEVLWFPSRQQALQAAGLQE